MEPQERDLITTLLTRLKSASGSGQPKDAEADALIRQSMAQMPDAPYYLVQTVLIQDLSMQNAQNRITELERQLAALPAPQQQQSTSFLGGLFGRSQPSAQPSGPSAGGPWTRAPQAAPPPQGYGQPQYAPQQPYAQQGYAPQQQAPGGGLFGGGGGGFLRSAAATAAGVAGGALLFQGISSLFGHSYANSLGGFGGMGGGMPGGLSETVVNNYYGDNQGGGGDYGGGGGDYGGGGGDYTAGGDTGYDKGGDYGGGGGDYGGGGGDYGGGGGGDYSSDNSSDFGGGDFGGGDSNSSC